MYTRNDPLKKYSGIRIRIQTGSFRLWNIKREKYEFARFSFSSSPIGIQIKLIWESEPFLPSKIPTQALKANLHLHISRDPIYTEKNKTRIQQ